MINEQIFVSFSEADKRRVSNIIRHLQLYHFKFWFDPQKRYPGDRFMDTIKKEINRSKLFMIFISKKRNHAGVLNAEIEMIREASKKIRTKPNIILVLMDNLLPDERREYVEDWLIDAEINFIEYVVGKTKATKSALLQVLNVWQRQFYSLPPGLGPTGMGKLNQEPDSKLVLARWVEKTFAKELTQYRSFFIGCGTTIAESWRCSWRNIFIANDPKKSIYTNNGFILFNEDVQKESNEKNVFLRQLGDVHIKEYAAYQEIDPAQKFPAVDFSIISVAGFKLGEDELNLRVCWEELRDTIKEVFVKTRKEILIIAAGRKIADSEGAPFIDLLSLLQKEASQKKVKLTLAIDTEIKPEYKKGFDEKLVLLSDKLGIYHKNIHYPILYWKTAI